MATIIMTEKDLQSPDWSRRIAKETADKLGIRMTWREWKVIDILRKYFLDDPSIPREKVVNLIYHEKRKTAFEVYVDPALKIAGITPFGC